MIIYRKFLLLLSKREVKWGLIPLIFILFWLSLSVFFISGAKFTILSYVHNNKVIENLERYILFKGHKVNGEFKAYEDHLGLIYIRFKTPTFVSFDQEDTVIFRIKEKGKKEWIQANSYRSGLIYGTPLFPFGFSVIDKSKGKTYQFQIESLRGNDLNELIINKDHPTFISAYQFSRNEIFSNWKSFSSYILKKIFTFFGNSDYLLKSIIYLLPLVYYFLWLLVVKVIKLYFPIPASWKNFFYHRETSRFKEKLINRYFLTMVSILGVTIDILVIRDVYIGVIAVILGTWISAIIANHFRSTITFLGAFLMIFISVFIIYFTYFTPYVYLVGKLAMWSYFLLGIGLVQEILELRDHPVSLTIKRFIKRFSFQ